MKQGTLVRSLLLTTVVTLAAAMAAAATPDELYYPASQCHPFNGGAWQGGGSAGFAFVPQQGGWYNFDDNDKEALACPVPYFRDANNLEKIFVRIVVDDRHPTQLVRTFLCERPITGAKSCVGKDNFPTVFGVSTLELSIQPDSATRFVWVEVEIPEDADDNNPFTQNGTSGLIGYRVFRN